MLQSQAIQDRDEFQKIIETQKEIRELEVKVQRNRLDKIKGYAVELKKQIAVKSENKQQDTRLKYESGKQIKDMLKSEHEVLEKIKREKLQVMKDLGIPEKYQVELANLKV